MPLLEQKGRGAWRESIGKKYVAAMWEEEERKAHVSKPRRFNPELFYWQLTERLPADAVLCADTGMSTTFFARAVKIKRGMKTVISGTLATMGPAVSYALAAKFAFPDRPVIAFVGDGAMQMLGMNGIITAAKYYKRWADPRLIVAVLNNRDLNMVSWELRALGGAPRLAETQGLPDIDYAAQAEILGLKGLTVAGPDDVGPAWDQALAADRPVVIDVKADPNVIALPPHATLEQTKNLIMALARGDSDRGAILDQLIKQLARLRRGASIWTKDQVAFSNPQTGLEDPQDKYPKPPFKQQKQPWPGLACKMEPPPDHGEKSYKGSGKLAGRKALITGGDSGMGRAAAIAFAREGADVAINYFPSEQEDADQVIALIREAGRNGVAIPGDLREQSFCRKLVEDAVAKLGGLDILVNNAARQQSYDSIADIPPEEFDATMKTNIYAPFWIIHGQQHLLDI